MANPEAQFTYSNEDNENVLRLVEKVREQFKDYIKHNSVITLGIVPALKIDTFKELVEGGGILSVVELKALTKVQRLAVIDHYIATLQEAKHFFEGLPDESTL